jgi:PAS domain S-box-containing protein
VDKNWNHLVNEYQRALGAYLAREEESHLQQAYEFGRTALNRGHGVFDMARLHLEALFSWIAASGGPAHVVNRANAVETFLLDALSPFEAAHRGFRKTSERLEQVNETLAQRNRELATANGKLQEEVVARKNTQEELAHRERQLAEAQRLANLGSFEWDLRTRKMLWSDELYRIHGLAPQEKPVSMKMFQAYVHPDGRKQARRLIAEAVRKRRSFSVDERIVREDGAVRTIHTEGAVVCSDAGKPLRLVGFCQDITERRRVEELWKRYESIVNTAREFLTLIDRNYRYEAANDAYCRAHGRSRDDIVGHKVSEIWGKRAFGSHLKHYLDQCFSGHDVHGQTRLEPRAAGRRIYDVSYYPYQQNGVVTHAIVVMRDVTERRQAEDALLDSEQKFRSVVESARDGIITADRAGRIVFLNHGAEGIFGYGREELLGRALAGLLSPKHRAGYRDKLRRLAAEDGAGAAAPTAEIDGVRQNGTEFPLELSLAAWRTRAGVFYTAMVRDITERKRAENALRESKEHYFQLFQQSRVMEESLRQLSNKVLSAQEEERKRISRELHDEIGAALTAVNVTLAMLKNHAGDNAAFHAKIGEAQKQLERTMQIAHRFARELRPDMLDHLGAHAALQSYLQSFSERTGIKAALSSKADLGRLDSQQEIVLFRVAQESLTNVAKHAHATRVNVDFRRLPHGVRMEIRDNGRSFPAQEQLNGKTSKRLGLLGMQERVRLVNGEFAIESEPGRGTTVRVDIPFTGRPRGPRQSPPSLPTAVLSLNQKNELKN